MKVVALQGMGLFKAFPRRTPSLAEKLHDHLPGLPCRRHITQLLRALSLRKTSS